MTCQVFCAPRNNAVTRRDQQATGSLFAIYSGFWLLASDYLSSYDSQLIDSRTGTCVGEDGQMGERLKNISTTEKHFLVIDVGNTTAHFGICTRERIVDQFRVPSNARAILGEGIRRVKKVSRSIHLIPRVLISSVVPHVNPALARLCRAVGLQPHWLSHGTATGVRLLYKKPSEIGADRIANALAAKELYGAPAIVVDMGTAITFDCISKSGAYVGGVIAPGLRLSCAALAERTGLLPLVDIQIPPGFIGKSTIHAIQSGIVHGTRALIAGIIVGLRREMGGKPRVILTGGQLELIVKGWRHPGIIDPFLTLHGLRIAYNKTVASS